MTRTELEKHLAVNTALVRDLADALAKLVDNVNIITVQLKLIAVSLNNLQDRMAVIEKMNAINTN